MYVYSKLRKNELDYISEDEDEYNNYVSDGLATTESIVLF